MKTQPTNASTWVHCTLDQRSAYWCNLSRLFTDATDEQRTDIVSALENGRTVVLESVNMEIDAMPLSARDAKRLAYLVKSFERSGFRLAYFQKEAAVFYREGHDTTYYSMNQMVEQSFLPKPGIAISPINVPVFEGDKLIDVFVPVTQGADHFTKHPTHHA